MKVEFGAMEETAIPGFKGGEGVTHARMFADGRNRIMRGRLEPGCSIGLHTHEGSSEIVYVLSGTGKALYGGGEERLAPGDCHYCPEGHAHSLVNDGTQTLEFFGPADAFASAGPCFVCRRAAIPRARRGTPP